MASSDRSPKAYEQLLLVGRTPAQSGVVPLRQTRQARRRRGGWLRCCGISTLVVLITFIGLAQLGRRVQRSARAARAGALGGANAAAASVTSTGPVGVSLDERHPLSGVLPPWQYSRAWAWEETEPLQNRTTFLLIHEPEFNRAFFAALDRMRCYWGLPRLNFPECTDAQVISLQHHSYVNTEQWNRYDVWRCTRSFTDRVSHCRPSRFTVSKPRSTANARTIPWCGQS